MYSLCGVKLFGSISSQICVDKMRKLCYGLTGCPVFKSFYKTSDLQSIFIYVSTVENYRLTKYVIEWENCHSVHEFCGLEHGVNTVFVGAGKAYRENEKMEICNVLVSLPATIEIEVC